MAVSSQAVSAPTAPGVRITGTSRFIQAFCRRASATSAERHSPQTKPPFGHAQVLAAVGPCPAAALRPLLPVFVTVA